MWVWVRACDSVKVGVYVFRNPLDLKNIIVDPPAVSNKDAHGAQSHLPPALKNIVFLMTSTAGYLLC